MERKRVKPKRLLVRRRTAVEMLDSSVSKLKLLEKQGRLTPIRLGSRDVHYAMTEIEALAEGDVTE
jgi:hypothetical protein